MTNHLFRRQHSLPLTAWAPWACLDLKPAPPRRTTLNEISDIFLSIKLGLARAVSKIVPPHEVEDVVQETYVRLCQVGAPEKINHPKSYLYKMARNLALDSLKRADNRITDSWHEGTESSGDFARLSRDETLEQAASSEEFGRFCEAVRQLPIQARRVFVLKKVYGYSQREIASELGLAESTVEKHVALAIRRCTVFMWEREWLESGQDNLKEAHGE